MNTESTLTTMPYSHRPHSLLSRRDPLRKSGHKVGEGIGGEGF